MQNINNNKCFDHKENIVEWRNWLNLPYLINLTLQGPSNKPVGPVGPSPFPGGPVSHNPVGHCVLWGLWAFFTIIIHVQIVRGKIPLNIKVEFAFFLLQFSPLILLRLYYLSSLYHFLYCYFFGEISSHFVNNNLSHFFISFESS